MYFMALEPLQGTNAVAGGGFEADGVVDPEAIGVKVPDNDRTSTNFFYATGIG